MTRFDLRSTRFIFGIPVLFAALALSFSPHVPVLLDQLGRTFGRSFIFPIMATDQMLHFAGCFFLMLWFGTVASKRHQAFLALAFIAFGALIEVAQGLMTTCRACEWGDVFADTAGVLLAYLLIRITFPFFRNLAASLVFFVQQRFPFRLR